MNLRNKCKLQEQNKKIIDVRLNEYFPTHITQINTLLCYYENHKHVCTHEYTKLP